MMRASLLAGIPWCSYAFPGYRPLNTYTLDELTAEALAYREEQVMSCCSDGMASGSLMESLGSASLQQGEGCNLLEGEPKATGQRENKDVNKDSLPIRPPHVWGPGKVQIVKEIMQQEAAVLDGVLHHWRGQA